MPLTDPFAPLAGLRVIDCSRVLAGPFAAQTLGDLGAEILKLERPGHGDDTRAWGPPFLDIGMGMLSAYFLACNRNKRSIAVDVAHPDGRQILERLLDDSDILIENFRTDSLDRLDLTPERLLKRHPRLIICSISGFGRTGTNAKTLGYDFAIQALSGLMAHTGSVEGSPAKVGVPITDILTGLYASTAILACVHARSLSGHGYAIDLALHDCAVAAQPNLAQSTLITGESPARHGNAHPQIVPYELFETADGWIVLAVGNDRQWRAFLGAADWSELVDDSRFTTNPDRVRHRAELVPMIAAKLRTRSLADWLTRLHDANVPCSPVRNLAEVMTDPAFAERGMRISVRDPAGRPVDIVGSPLKIAGTTMPTPTLAPQLGADTDSVLATRLGFDPEMIARFRKSGIIG